MSIIWILFALFAISRTQALEVADDDDAFPDYWQDDDSEWYNDELENLGILSAEDIDTKENKDNIAEQFSSTLSASPENIDEDNDRRVAEDIERFRDEEKPIDMKSNSDNLVDYQFEDNRSEVEDDDQIDDDMDEDEDENENERKENIEDDSLSISDLSEELDELNQIRKALEINEETIKSSVNEKYDAVPEESQEYDFDNPSSDVLNVETDDIGNSNENKKATTENDEIFKEIQRILNEKDSDEDFLKVQPLKPVEQENMKEIIDETKKILEETDNKLDEDQKPEKDELIYNKSEASKEKELDLPLDEDDLTNFEMAYDDILNFDKLSLDSEKAKSDLNDENASYDDNQDVDSLLNKFLNLDQDYVNIDDDHIKELFSNKLTDDDLESLEVEEPHPDDARSEEEQKGDKSQTIQYVNDALVASDENLEPDAEIINQEVSSQSTSKVEQITESSAGTTQNYDDLSSSEYEAAVSKFKSEHSEILDFKSEDFDKHVAPVHITLNRDEPVVITSPNYPSAYPTNNIVDWILEGDGEGIEFNVTDFAVNGHMGDYLLVKPGGVDASGNDGLIFTYTLTSKRQYWFTNVRRMFLRFEARPGMQFMRGFSLSAKMLTLPSSSEEREPIPEPDTQSPYSSITLNLGGLTLEEFMKVKEDFRQIVADMATMYINSAGIDPGLNTTSEVTGITSMAMCFHNWPKFEKCVEVMFKVPLVYEDDQEPRLSEEDLTNMWFTFANTDPFASRLRRLGISEYQVPNDRGVLMVWLVIAAGVIISMAMLAFALWRFSCFEEYTRMPPFSDTDSVQEKRNLDLYPTPHQTLPPLYAENEYKWDIKFDDSARVDMGGYANKNYMRDDVYDLDSDEDVLAARDSNKNISARDVYNV